MQGHLTQPLRYDAASDTYVACDWDEAFAAIGAELQRLEPKSVVFYALGKASLEPSYLYSVFARSMTITICPTVRRCATRPPRSR
jgi:anaerobic selenocysteine-containing dehydrogenase